MSDSSSREHVGKMTKEKIRKEDSWRNKERQERKEERTQSQRRTVNRPDRSPRWMDRRKDEEDFKQRMLERD